MTNTLIPTTVIPTTIILVRHGNTFESDQVPYYVGSRTDLPLTARGEQQAKEVAQELSRRSLWPNVVYSGGLIRQRRTAEIIVQTIATQIAIPLATTATSINIAPCLSELDLGAWEGMTTDKVKQCYPTEYEAWERDSTWPQGIFLERKEERLLQLRDWLSQLESESGEFNNVVLAVTSNGVLRLLYELMTTMGTTSMPDVENLAQNVRKKVDNSLCPAHTIHKAKVGTGCLCLVTLNAGRIVLREWNTRPKTTAGQ